MKISYFRFDRDPDDLLQFSQDFWLYVLFSLFAPTNEKLIVGCVCLRQKLKSELRNLKMVLRRFCIFCSCKNNRRWNARKSFFSIWCESCAKFSPCKNFLQISSPFLCPRIVVEMKAQRTFNSNSRIVSPRWIN